ALRLIGEADFSDLRRLKDLVMEMKNELRSGFSNLGHLYASARAARFMSPSTKTGETWNGISQLIFAHQLAEMDMAEISAKLVKLRDAIAGNGLFVNLAGSDIALNAASKLIGQQFSRFGSPRARAADSTGVLHPPETQASPEVFASPSLQVGFAAMTLTAAAFDTHDQAAESVLMHYLNTGALWEDIRMKGGAYGASANSDNLERCFSLSTYRDPSPLRSLDSFSSILKDYAVKTIEKDELEKTIIGAYSRETRPRTPSEKSASDFLRYVSFIDNECRQRKLERIIGMGKNDISAALNKLASQAASGRVIITGMKDAEQAAAALGTQVQELPV
ncbi:MAG: peptidase M16, partial [Treponema sp.]|nr:peptidase M16 [Treponema sp.]